MQAEKSVLITGTSTGMGHATALYLAEQGYHVYAGVRSETDARQWDEYELIEAVMLDVTKPAMIDTVYTTIKEDTHKFYALINNAGTIDARPLMDTSHEEFSYVFDVNLFGPIRLVQTFSPLLEKNQGRIINISSINGFVPSPKDGGYSMSKHALEAFSEQLQYELSPEIKVSVIQPGLFRTAIVDRLIKQLQPFADAGDEEAKQSIAFYSDDNNFSDPKDIAMLIGQILEDDSPAFRYIIGSEVTEGWAVSTLLQRLVTSSYSVPKSLDDLTMELEKLYYTNNITGK